MSLRDIVENQTIRASCSFIPFYTTTSLLSSQHLIKIYKQHKYFQCIVGYSNPAGLTAANSMHRTPREGLICHQITSNSTIRDWFSLSQKNHAFISCLMGR